MITPAALVAGGIRLVVCCLPVRRMNGRRMEWNGMEEMEWTKWTNGMEWNGNGMEGMDQWNGGTQRTMKVGGHGDVIVTLY